MNSIGARDDYLERAEKRLKDVGIPYTTMANLILSTILKSRPLRSSEEEDVEESWTDLFTEEQVEAVFNWLDVKLTAILESIDPRHPTKPGALDQERQKLYLRELSYKYHGILKKLECLTPLPFEESQLDEATRCWLYGFYRATVLFAQLRS